VLFFSYALDLTPTESIDRLTGYALRSALYNLRRTLIGQFLVRPLVRGEELFRSEKGGIEIMKV